MYEIQRYISDPQSWLFSRQLRTHVGVWLVLLGVVGVVEAMKKKVSNQKQTSSFSLVEKRSSAWFITDIFTVLIVLAIPTWVLENVP